MYGVPTYKEINPAPFYIVTFPFMFGIMFGDIGHGFLLLLAGISLILLSDQDFMKKGPMKEVRSARYLLFLLGFFSFFAGFMYNDFMSIPLQLNNSCY